MSKIIINIDGGSRGNPGESAMGVVFSDEKGKLLKNYSQAIGIATNNEAEYKALVFAFKKAKALFGKEKIRTISFLVQSDSELLIKQMRGEYKILDQKIQLLFLEAWNLKTDFPKVDFCLVPRKSNFLADKLVNEALDVKEKTRALF